VPCPRVPDSIFNRVGLGALYEDTIPFTQEFLSKMLGVRRGTMSTIATRFETAKLIRTGRGQIEILNRAGLKKEACSCYEFVARHIDRLLPDA
jgi:hypothetical protein